MSKSTLSIYDVNRWFPSNYNRGPNLLVWVAIVASFIAVFIKLWTSTSQNRWPEAIATLLFLYPLVSNWKQLKSNLLLKLWGLAIIAPFLFFGINYFINPVLAVEYADFERLARIYLFIPIAWWLGGSKRTIGLYFFIAVLGLLFAIITRPEFVHQLQLLVAGKRMDYAIDPLNAQHVGLIFSLILIGCLSYFSSIKFKENLALNVFLVVLCLISLVSIWGAQTRAAAIGLFAAAAVWLGVLFLKYFLVKKNSSFSAKAKWVVALVVAVLIAFGAFATNQLAKRFSSESETLSALVNQQWDEIPYTSIGIRINTWIQAVEWIKEKPIIGYGGKVRKDIIRQSTKHPQSVKDRYGHFHNSYIELTLGFGILGALLAFAPFIVGFFKLRCAEEPMKSFFVYGSTLFLVMCFFESYLFFWIGPYLLTILLGGYFSSVYFKEFKN